jgi:predicted nucleic acid-binding protein
MSSLIDTNVLLRLRDSADPHHPDCRTLLEAANVDRFELVICAQVLIEYWVVATRPAGRNGFGLTVVEAAADIRSFRAMLPCVAEVPQITDHWFEIVVRHQVMGKAAHDARIVALAMAAGIRRVVTLNAADFFAVWRDRIANPGSTARRRLGPCLDNPPRSVRFFLPELARRRYPAYLSYARFHRHQHSTLRVAGADRRAGRGECRSTSNRASRT